MIDILSSLSWSFIFFLKHSIGSKLFIYTQIVLFYLFCCWSVFRCYSCLCKFLCRLFLCICLLVILQLKELCILMALQNKLNLQSNWWLRLPARSAFFLLLCIFMVSVIALPSSALSALFRLLLVHSVYYLVLWFSPGSFWKSCFFCFFAALHWLHCCTNQCLKHIVRGYSLNMQGDCYMSSSLFLNITY